MTSSTAEIKPLFGWSPSLKSFLKVCGIGSFLVSSRQLVPTTSESHANPSEVLSSSSLWSLKTKFSTPMCLTDTVYWTCSSPYFDCLKLAGHLNTVNSPTVNSPTAGASCCSFAFAWCLMVGLTLLLVVWGCLICLSSLCETTLNSVWALSYPVPYSQASGKYLVRMLTLTFLVSPESRNFIGQYFEF